MQNFKLNPFIQLLITLLLGLMIGFLTWIFINLLATIAIFHTGFNSQIPYHLLLIPIVLIITELVKKNTLYFPTKSVHLTEEKSSNYWSVFMSFFHFVGTLLSHLSGVSVGRESAVVLFSAGLVRVFKLAWTFWGPVVSSIGFACVVGQHWVAPFFMMELFGKTSLTQKVYSLMGATVAVLFLKTLNTDTIFAVSLQPFEIGFFQKLFFLFFFAATAGYLMRIYKYFYFELAKYFNGRGVAVRLLVATILAFFLYLPDFRKYQSLGLNQITDGHFNTGSVLNSITKLFFTLISTTLGFFGGEFIPLIYSGLNFGFGFFAYFGFEGMTGAALGAYLLFTAATRFKWTGYILALNLLGLSWWFWAFFAVSITAGFSGSKSIYRKELVS